jgi:hypothetical protein
VPPLDPRAWDCLDLPAGSLEAVLAQAGNQMATLSFLLQDTTP